MAIGLTCASLLSCGGAGLLTSPTPIRNQCPSEDTYLADFYTLVEAGKLDTIRAVMRDELDADIRSDLAVAMIRLVGWVPSGTFEGLQRWGESVDGAGIEGKRLAIVIRWVAQNGPSAPYQEQFSVARDMLASCPGEQTMRLAADFLHDVQLSQGTADFLGDLQLQELLSEFELEDEKGRAALKALVRNLMATLSSSSFDVDALLDLVGLLLDFDSAEGANIRDLLHDFLSTGERRDALVGFVQCFTTADPELHVIDLLYDAFTDDALALTTLLDGSTEETSKDNGSAQPPIDEDGNTGTLRTLAVLADGMADDATVRRGVAKLLTLMLHPDYASGVLMDVSNVLEADLLTNFVKLAAAYATNSCE